MTEPVFLADLFIPMPFVAKMCKRCGVTEGDVARVAVVISPSGTAHFGDGGFTDCGVDATGDRWWWPC